MKTIRHLFTVLMLLCSAVAFAHDFEVGGIYYDITNATNKTVSVTYQGDSYYAYSNEYTGSVVIPQNVTYGGVTYSVTSIGNSAFRDCNNLTSIEIPNSVTSIRNYAFEGCFGLTSIVIPNSVTSIGYSAFSDCTGLTSIVIPNSVTSIESDAFESTAWYDNQPNGIVYAGKVLYKYKGTMPANTSIVIKEGTTAISGYAFRGCTNLTSIEIPNSVTSIGNEAFKDCTRLTSIEIPNSVTSIESDAFESTAWYDNQPDGVVYAGNILYKYKGTMPSNTSIVIKEGTTAIGVYAFYSCSGLTSITIPNSVTSIGNDAFSGCSGLTSIEIPNSVTSIGNYAFESCSGLTSIVIGNSVTSIGSYAFRGCKGLKTVINFSNLTFSRGYVNNGYIAYYADKVYNAPNSSVEGDYIWDKPNGVNTLLGYFGNDAELTLPANYNGEDYAIGESAFSSCVALTSVVIPNSVTSIGDGAFGYCTNLTSIEIPNSVTSIGDGAFDYCTNLASIEIPNSVTSIGNEAFKDCTRLTSVVIGNSVTSIGDWAFGYCIGLTSIVIPNSVTSIGNYAFNGCYALTDLCIEDGEEILYLGISEYFVDGDYHIAVSMFQDCPLKTLYIGRNWDFAESELYNSYTAPFNHKLTSVTIGNNVTSFKNFEFFDCTGITSVTSLIPADELFAINSYVFNYVDKTSCTLYVPYGAKETYAATEGWSEFENIVELERSTFNATFYIDGEEIATSEIKAGEAVAYPDVDEREGYTLVWTTDVDIMPANDIVIEGTFIANTYTVTYTVDGDVYATDSIAYGSEIVLRDEPAKEGYTFSGWSEAPQTMPANDIVIEGSFRVNSYKVTFVVDGELYKSMDVVYGAEIPTVAQPVKDGRKFSGWSEIPSTMPAQDVVVEGKFCYTVVFMIDGKYYSSSALYYGDEIVAPSGIPQKEGYAFVEWGELPSAMPARDMTIHAIFSVEKYQLMFIIDGEVYQTLFVGYGSEIEYPQKDGYIITWETENLPQTMPAENLIIIGTSALDTAVECVKDDNEKIVYTLDGHRILDVENLEKGVYIINGKKVLVK